MGEDMMYVPSRRSLSITRRQVMTARAVRTGAYHFSAVKDNKSASLSALASNYCTENPSQDEGKK